MRILVFSLQVGSRTSTRNVASRNAIELARLLGADRLVYHTDRVAGQYDAIILPYVNRYLNFPVLYQYIRPHQAHILLRTEYEPVTCAHVKGWVPYIEICNFDNQDGPNINTNLLMAFPPNKRVNKTHGVVYYGRFRADRVGILSKYASDLDAISTSAKNVKAWKAAGIKARFVDGLSWDTGREQLNRFRYSLYAEDAYTNSVFNNLANRWYEAGVCNAVVLFDRACLNTISRSELAPYMDEVMRYVVDDGPSMRAKIADMDKDWPAHLATQKAWRINEPVLKAAMVDQVRELIAEEVRIRKEPILAP